MKPSFNGLRILSLESRRATEIASLISNFGGQPTVAPALREVPLSSNREALAFGAAVDQGQFEAVIFLTGVGARALLSVIELERPRERFIEALKRTRVAVRGPKPAAVMREWQVPVWVAAPEPNTWRELLDAIRPRIGDLPPRPRVAIQEYGVSNPELVEGLRALGAEITTVPVYQWALPEDLEPLKQAIGALARREIDIALFTTGVQAAHLFDVAESLHATAEVREGLAQSVVASIGPTTSEELHRRGLRVDLEASHPKMGILVTEAAEQGETLLKNKRTS